MSNDQLRIDITNRSTEFAIRIIKLANKLPRTPAGFAIASQIVRSGTSIGANIQEAQSGLTRKDFIHSINISLKEARETLYWIKIIQGSKLIDEEKLSLLLKENDEIVRILFTIIKNSKKNAF